MNIHCKSIHSTWVLHSVAIHRLVQSMMIGLESALQSKIMGNAHYYHWINHFVHISRQLFILHHNYFETGFGHFDHFSDLNMESFMFLKFAFHHIVFTILILPPNCWTLKLFGLGKVTHQKLYYLELLKHDFILDGVVLELDSEIGCCCQMNLSKGLQLAASVLHGQYFWYFPYSLLGFISSQRSSNCFVME